MSCATVSPRAACATHGSRFRTPVAAPSAGPTPLKRAMGAASKFLSIESSVGDCMPTSSDLLSPLSRTCFVATSYFMGYCLVYVVPLPRHNKNPNNNTVARRSTEG